MLKVGKNLELEVSQGDYFDITFKITGLTLEEGATITFAVKKAPREVFPVLLKQAGTIATGTNSVRFIIESYMMKDLDAGEYVYDLTYAKGNNRRTLNYPTPFIVKGVVDHES